MSERKRVLIIVCLLIFISFIINITNIYENRIILRKKEVKIENRYSPFRETSNFKNENRERYVEYYENNKDLSYEEVVTFVNIGLDKGFYNYITDANLDKKSLILVNKFHKLDNEYVPNDLETIDSKYFINGNQNVRKLKKEAKEAFERLSSDSIKNATPVYGQSAYRSYEMQSNLYNNAIAASGKNKADMDTARPGHSEHQTGLAIDVSSNKIGNMLTFGDTDSYRWMMDNAYKYGFILRYTKEKENIHGYINEPWHYRYVGVQVAKDIHDNHSHLTYDEYYYKFIDK